MKKTFEYLDLNDIFEKYSKFFDDLNINDYFSIISNNSFKIIRFKSDILNIYILNNFKQLRCNSYVYENVKLISETPEEIIYEFERVYDYYEILKNDLLNLHNYSHIKILDVESEEKNISIEVDCLLESVVDFIYNKDKEINKRYFLKDKLVDTIKITHIGSNAFTFHYKNIHHLDTRITRKLKIDKILR